MMALLDGPPDMGMTTPGSGQRLRLLAGFARRAAAIRRPARRSVAKSSPTNNSGRPSRRANA